MSDNVENLLLEMLKALRNELRDFRSRHEHDMEDLKFRMENLETAMIGVKREVNLGDHVDVRQQVAIDRILARIDRLERRLELAN